jgi:fatty acid elongase 3
MDVVSDTIARVLEPLKTFNDYMNSFEYSNETPFTNYKWPFSFSFGYLVVIWALHKFMTNRAPMKVYWAGLIHNFNMFALSLIMLIGLVYGMVRGLWGHSLEECAEIMACDSKKQLVRSGPLYFWMYIFYLSKFYELFDTVLIVLRKSKLRFLHVYHHWITMVLCWVSLETELPVQWLANILNSLVHVPMYYYYAMAILKVDVWWKKYITMMQIIQFVLVLTLHTTSFLWHYLYTKNCNSFDDTWGNQFGITVIASYLVLFIHFYAQTYKSGEEGSTPRTPRAPRVSTDPKKTQ